MSAPLLDDGLGLLQTAGDTTLCRSELADDPTGMAFRDAILPSGRLDGLPAPIGRYNVEWLIEKNGYLSPLEVVSLVMV